MDAKHTPGPWAVDEHTPGLLRITSRGGKYGTALVCPAQILGDALDEEYGPVTWANARLIAAAPDLLAACDEMLRTLVAPSRQLLESTRKELAQWLPMLREAVAKAKGE